VADKYLKIFDLRGGINDGDSPMSLAPNECTEAVNVDFREGQLGTKRGGCSPLVFTNSVFARAVPTMAQRNTGGWLAANSGNVVSTAHAGPNTNQIMMVTITVSAGTVTAVTYNGEALTFLAGVTLGSRVEVWYKRNPALSGTVAVTLSGAADASVIAERWDNVDTAASPAFATTTSGTSEAPTQSNNSHNAESMSINALAYGNATLTLDPVGTLESSTVINGSARVASAAKIGMLPTNFWVHELSASVQWASVLYALVGVSSSGGVPLKDLMRFQPTNDVADDELWAIDSYGRLDRRTQAGGWQGGVPVVNYKVGAFLSTAHGSNGVSLHGKFFLALHGTTYADRTHVWDGTVLRWSGLDAPAAAPTAADSGGAGTLSGTRYGRVRWTQVVNGVTVLRSEPSAVQTFTPSGGDASITWSRPSGGGFTSGSVETHWELELSIDNNLFYRVGSFAVATLTYVDTQTLAAGYADIGDLSEALTEYTPLPAANHLAADEDRLLLGGSPYTPVNDSRVSWTPLRADLGVGNDERVPATARFFLDLLGLNSGGLTMLMPAVMGGIWAFKNSQMHKLVRSGRPSKAYDSVQISPSRGCLPRAAHAGTDEHGIACVYFTDQNVGACRYGANGLEDLMQKRRALAARINLNASVSAVVVFYPKHWLVWYALTLDSSAVPNYLACFNIRQRSWTDYTGNIATAVSAILFPDVTTNKLRPHLAPGTAVTSNLVIADQGVTDDGTRFRGYLVSKAFQLGELFSEFEIDGAVLVAKASDSEIEVAAIRNTGLEEKRAQPQSIVGSGEAYTTVQFDDLAMAELEQAQFEVGDPESYSGADLEQTWTLEGVAIRPTSGTEAG
jgi:hypothetical protein